MFKSGGEKVYAGEVEGAIAQHEAVAEVVVLGVADDKWGEVGRAVVVRRAGHALEGEAPQGLAPGPARQVQGAEDGRLRAVAAADRDGQDRSRPGPRAARRRCPAQRLGADEGRGSRPVRLSWALPVAGALVALAASARVAPAQAGDQKSGTAPEKTPPAPAELKLTGSIDRDPNGSAGSMEGGPHALAFSPDGTMLAVGNQDGALSVVDLGDAEQKPRWRRLAVHEGAVNAVAFIARGERVLIASVGDDGRVLIAPVDSGTATDRHDDLISRPLAIGPLSALAVLNAGPEAPRLVAASVRGGLAVLAISDQVTVEQTIEPTPPRDSSVVGLVALSEGQGRARGLGRHGTGARAPVGQGAPGAQGLPARADLDRRLARSPDPRRRRLAKGRPPARRQLAQGRSRSPSRTRVSRTRSRSSGSGSRAQGPASS